MKSNATPTPTRYLRLKGTAVPRVIEFSAHGTGVGKTIAAHRTRHHLDKAGVKNVLVTIESRAVLPHRKLRGSDVFISTEDFKLAREMPGGLPALLRPMYLAIAEAAREGSVVIIDWPGGAAHVRLEAMAATRFGQRIRELGISCISVIVTTASLDRMKQATENLLSTAEVAPGIRRGLLLNERAGKFEFIAGTALGDAFKDLMVAAEGAEIIRFGSIVGESWQACEAAGLSFEAVLRATAAHIADATRLDLFTAAATQTEVLTWWDATKLALDQVFPFRQPGDQI